MESATEGTHSDSVWHTALTSGSYSSGKLGWRSIDLDVCWMWALLDQCSGLQVTASINVSFTLRLIDNYTRGLLEPFLVPLGYRI